MVLPRDGAFLEAIGHESLLEATGSGIGGNKGPIREMMCSEADPELPLQGVTSSNSSCFSQCLPLFFFQLNFKRTRILFCFVLFLNCSLTATVRMIMRLLGLSRSQRWKSGRQQQSHRKPDEFLGTSGLAPLFPGPGLSLAVRHQRCVHSNHPHQSPVTHVVIL